MCFLFFFSDSAPQSWDFFWTIQQGWWIFLYFHIHRHIYILYYMILYYIILYYMIWYYIILFYIISYYIIWYYIILFYIISYYIILYIIWYYIILYYIIIYYIIIYYIIIYYIILYYTILYYIILYYIILHIYIYVISPNCLSSVILLELLEDEFLSYSQSYYIHQIVFNHLHPPCRSIESHPMEQRETWTLGGFHSMKSWLLHREAMGSL